MGKSDPIIYKEYLQILRGLQVCESVAFLGFTGENEFTQRIESKVRHFYDKQLNNWEINSNWSLSQKYDLIVCTRCAYFSKEPENFVKKCESYLNKRGHALIDWGLGDHWRFNDYKVGWTRNGEHEYAYEKSNKLYSCFWNDSLESDDDVKSFWKYVVQKPDFGYSRTKTLTQVIKEEVPSIVCYDTKKIVTKFLWPDSPQLYIITLIELAN